VFTGVAFYDDCTMPVPEPPDPPAETTGARDAPPGHAGKGRRQRTRRQPAPHGSETVADDAPNGRPPSRSTVRRWVQRSEHDRRSRPRLEFVADEVVVLNDRRVPGSKLSIDLVAVSPAGVFVIEAKNYKGLVYTKRLGPVWDLGPHQLHIGRRNCTSSIDDVTKKGEAVRGVLLATPWGSEVPVKAVLCLTRADWGYAAGVEVDDVLVAWPKLIAGRMKEPVVMDSSTVQEVSEMIAQRLPTGRALPSRHPRETA
jgi:Nuclease-related domain